MKTVLMVAPYFPPRRRVGSLRPFKFAIHLRQNGWNPVILTIAHSGDLTEKEKRLLEGIQVIKVKPPFDRSGKPNKSNYSVEKTKPSFADKTGNWIDKHTPVDSWIFLFWMKYLGILNQVKTVGPDLIWSTGDPWSGHWLAEKLAQDTALPWIADFRDPWTLTDVNLRQRSPFSAEADKRIERRVIENADKLVFTSTSTEKKYAAHYGFSPEKSTTIYNSFDRLLFQNPVENSWNTFLDPDKLHLFFYGAFRRLSPAGPIANAIHELKQTDPEAADRIRIHSFGSSDDQETRQIKSHGLTDNFIEHPPVLPEQTLSVLNRADLLLVSTHSSRKHIIPAKLWDYMAADRPIFSIAPNPEIQTILENSGAGVQADPEKPAQIAKFLEKFVRSRQKGESVLPVSAGAGRADFDASETTKRLVSVFDELITHG